MTFSRHYFKESNFMHTKVNGEIAGSDLSRHVIALNQETKGIVNLKELADCREITKINLSTQEITYSAGNEQNKPGSKPAILTSKNKDVVYGMANAYRMFSEDYRESVKLFSDLKEALSWLSENDLEEESLSKLINSA